MDAPEVSVTVPLMSPALVAWPNAAPVDTAIRTAAHTPKRLNFIPDLQKKILPLYVLLIPVYGLSLPRQTVVFTQVAVREQYNRTRHKVVKHDLPGVDYRTTVCLKYQTAGAAGPERSPAASSAHNSQKGQELCTKTPLSNRFVFAMQAGEKVVS
jgi:hypothetical protein